MDAGQVVGGLRPDGVRLAVVAFDEAVANGPLHIEKAIRLNHSRFTPWQYLENRLIPMILPRYFLTLVNELDCFFC